jgi:hypothetical protein
MENLTDQEIEDFLEESSFSDDFLSGAEWAFGRALKIFDDFQICRERNRGRRKSKKDI